MQIGFSIGELSDRNQKEHAAILPNDRLLGAGDLWQCTPSCAVEGSSVLGKWLSPCDPSGGGQGGVLAAETLRAMMAKVFVCEDGCIASFLTAYQSKREQRTPRECSSQSPLFHWNCSSGMPISDDLREILVVHQKHSLLSYCVIVYSYVQILALFEDCALCF